MQTGIALGSNLGDRLANLQAGRDFLLTLHAVPHPPAVSQVHETAPVDCPPGSVSFLNAIIEIDTSLAPHDLLQRLAAFEQTCGRAAQREQNSPRPLDLDILYYGELILDTPDLVLPHPRMTLRRFVLQPLAELRPGLILPGQHRTVADLLQDLPGELAVHLHTAAW
jgi:2-amino-4-hydroxy-6-hydroxymethyldihydropteridine diphosphokinase